MTQGRLTPGGRGYSETGLWQAAVEASRLLQPSPLAVRCRKPLLDGDCPEVADVDLVAIWERPEELPERTTFEGPLGRVFVDVLWIPASALLDPVEAAGYMMLPHLLSESEAVSTRSGSIGSMVEKVRLSMYEKEAWERRIGQQINFGDAALKEASRNMDFPPAVLFFLQTAHAYYATALADCLKQSVMSLLTRPISKVRRMSAETGLQLEKMVDANLHLDADPSPSLGALERVHAAATARGSPRLVQRLGERTRGHYLYSISPLELEYREAVAKALLGRKDRANANFFLRFWAYSLSRCPVVLEEARQGRETSFYVPFRPFKESVQAACPEMLDDMETIFGGKLTAAEARECVEGTEDFRTLATGLIRERGMRLTSARDAARP
ncbi:MAG TPA: hypothetical protein VFB30_07850 [Spirochaetia bacterium]|nr:hypothetical protein [Spirochaetia bacterium]